MNRLRILDIFCGAGGLSFGFANNSFFELVVANDIDQNAIKAYKLNHSTTNIICKDIANLSYEDITEFGVIDIVLGGPPCQSYSTLGKRKMDDRAKLFKEYLRIIEIVKPSMFIFENVVGLISMQKGNLFKDICKLFESLGYRINFKILNAAEFGVPQIRERVIIVGIKNSYKSEFKFPIPTHYDPVNATLFECDNLSPFVSIKDALDDLPSIKSGENGNNLGYKFNPNNRFLQFVRTSKKLSEHESPNNNNNLIKIMQFLKDGQSKDDLPAEIRPKSGYSNTYAKMFWNKPAPTITRNFSTPSSSRCIHPRDSRAMSIREGARLQSFPDDYLFFGSNTDKRLQIGNAVPPLLSIALATAVENYFKDNINV